MLGERGLTDSSNATSLALISRKQPFSRIRKQRRRSLRAFPLWQEALDQAISREMCAGLPLSFITAEGNFDLVGNNIPVFFIQDAMKFPDLVHTAHDIFWDFISLTPESMHMVAWIMSDRTIPRSLRMMEGFGVHTFRMIDATGQSPFCKVPLAPYYWRGLGCLG